MSTSDFDPDDPAAVSSLFTDPPDFYPPSPPPTTLTYPGPTAPLTLRLVGYNPLWGHHLWNGARVLSTYLSQQQQPSLVANKTVVELGAGAGLPSLVAAQLGARQVVVSDYPDAALVENLCWNVEHCEGVAEGVLVAEGYLWGADVGPLLKHLKPVVGGEKGEKKGEEKRKEGEGEEGDAKFDVLILADLLFNHSEHAKLVQSVKALMAKDGKALVFFTPYRPWLLEADMAFFDEARAEGLVVEKVLEEKMDKVMFEEDRGDEELRRTVFGYVLTWKEG